MRFQIQHLSGSGFVELPGGGFSAASVEARPADCHHDDNTIRGFETPAEPAGGLVIAP